MCEVLITNIGLINLRSIKFIQFKPCKSLNIILGHNNAGKTTILESISLASSSKSFKGVDLDSLINNQSKSFQISIKSVQNTLKSSITIEKHLSSAKKLLINEKSSSTKQSLLLLPVLSMNFGYQNIFTQSSEHRRNFLDWGVFHVEHEHHSTLKDYNRVLVSRNKALKTKNYDVISPWTNKLIELAMKISKRREDYFNILYQSFSGILTRVNKESTGLYRDIAEARLSFFKGWEGDLSDVLDSNLNRDIALGYTSVGPHRAELISTTASGAIKDMASMSSQVILNLCLSLAQSETFHVKHKYKPILLMDDLFFGIDNKNLEVVVKLLNESEQQCFLSAPNSFKDRVINMRVKPKGTIYQLDKDIIRADED